MATAAAVGVLALSAGGVAAGPADAPVAAIHAMMDAFNTGDMATFNASYVSAPVTIIDEFGQHLWTGRTAPADWAAAQESFNRSNSFTGGVMTIGEVREAAVTGASAYVVVAAEYTFNDGGRKQQEAGLFTFVMERVNGEWKIRAWAWSGSNPPGG